METSSISREVTNMFLIPIVSTCQCLLNRGQIEALPETGLLCRLRANYHPHVSGTSDQFRLPPRSNLQGRIHEL